MILPVHVGNVNAIGVTVPANEFEILNVDTSVRLFALNFDLKIASLDTGDPLDADVAAIFERDITKQTLRRVLRFLIAGIEDTASANSDVFQFPRAIKRTLKDSPALQVISGVTAQWVAIANIVDSCIENHQLAPHLLFRRSLERVGKDVQRMIRTAVELDG